MEGLLKQMANKIPAEIRKHLLQEKFIEKAVNIDTRNTPMEYLFDVYGEFLDPRGEFADWYCHKCREHVLSQFKRMKTHLLLIENGNTVV